jgi:hypothetical protein
MQELRRRSRLGCSQAVAYCVDLSVSRVGGELGSCVRPLFPCDGRKQQFFITDSEIFSNDAGTRKNIVLRGSASVMCDEKLTCGVTILATFPRIFLSTKLPFLPEC